MHGFDIYFSGEIVAGKDPVEVQTAIGRLFKLNDTGLANLFSGKPVRIKANLKAEEAGKYRKVFLQSGALIHVVPEGAPPPSTERAPNPPSPLQPVTDDKDGMQLLPPNTGTLIDTATPSEEYDLSQADQFNLLPAGALLPDKDSEPEFAWESISHVEVMPANTGSLEEFEMPKKPVKVPDTSKLHTVDGGNLSDDAAQPDAAAIPATDHLQASPPNTGTLEDCAEEKPPVDIPDISSIKLD